MKIPSKWNEISLETLQELMLLEDSKLSDFRKTVERISILLNVDSDAVLKMKNSEITSIANSLAWTNEYPQGEVDVEPHELKELNDLTVGEWIDLEAWTERMWINSHLIVSVLLSSEAYDSTRIKKKARTLRSEINAAQAIHLIRVWMKHRDKIYEQFKTIFTSDSITEKIQLRDETPAQRKKREREEEIMNRNAKRTNWWNMLDMLSGHDPLRYKDATELNLNFAFKYLEFKKWKDKQ